MPEVTVNGINLYYEIYGEGEPLIFIHGFAVDHSVLQHCPSTIKILIRLFYLIIAVLVSPIARTSLIQ